MRRSASPSGATTRLVRTDGGGRYRANKKSCLTVCVLSLLKATYLAHPYSPYRPQSTTAS